MSRPKRYRIHAYVCGSSCVRYMAGEGTVTFEQVFTQRPDDCRYAVVSHWNIASHGDDVMVWDLFDVRRGKGGIALIEPPPIRVVDSVDVAIMATALLYDEEG